MGRRRAEGACASFLRSYRAVRPSHPFRRAYSSNRRKEPVDEPVYGTFKEAHAAQVLPDGSFLLQEKKFPSMYQDWPTIHHHPKKTGLKSSPHVAVLGGGLTGLTTAFYLARKLPPSSKIVVYEASQRWGGWIKSERVKIKGIGSDQEVLFERGPRLISLRPSQGRLDKLIFVDIMETLGLLPVHTPRNLSRYMWDSGKLRALDELSDHLSNPNFWKIIRDIFASGRVWGHVCMFATIMRHRLPRAILEVVRRTRPALPIVSRDLSVGDLMQRFLGSKTLVDVHLSALLHGIWGGDVNKLSAISAMGPSYDLLKQTMASGIADSLLLDAPEGSFFYPKKEYRFFQRFFDDLSKEGRTEAFLDLWAKTPDSMAHAGPHGLESLPLGLADMLKSAPNVELRLGCGVEGVHHDKQFEKVRVVDKTGKSARYDKVISTLPAENLATVAKEPLQLSEFSSVTMMTVNIWYPLRNLVPQGVGYLIPASTPFEENPERALGVFFDSRAGVGECAGTMGQVKAKPETTNGMPRREDGAKLFVLMGGHLYDRDGVKPPTQEEAIEQAKSLLERHLGIPRDVPCHATANLVKNCLPQHNVGHYDRLEALHDDLVKNYGNRLAVAGGSFTKPGVAGAMRAGYDIADTIANDDFMATGLEECRAPWAYAGTPLTLVDGSKDNELFKTILHQKK